MSIPSGSGTCTPRMAFGLIVHDRARFRTYLTLYRDVSRQGLNKLWHTKHDSKGRHVLKL